MRVGLLGWHCPTGIGYMNLDLYQLGLVDSWLIPTHPKLGVSPLPPGGSSSIQVCRQLDDKRTVLKFLSGVDVLIMVERPFLKHIDIWQECRKRKILTCCIPMLEFFPPPTPGIWTLQPDIVWAVNRHTLVTLQNYSLKATRQGTSCNWKDRILGMRWGVNLDRFPFQPRTQHNRFLFLNGWGGTKDRKGADIISRAALFATGVEIRVLSQTAELPEFPNNVTVDRRIYHNPAELYQQGDILLMPSRWEGLGLQTWEAYASGLPVIASNTPPLDELPGAIMINGRQQEYTLSSQLVVAGLEPAARLLADLLLQHHHTDITQWSKICRQEAEKVSLRQQFGRARIKLDHWLTKQRLKT